MKRSSAAAVAIQALQRKNGIPVQKMVPDTIPAPVPAPNAALTMPIIPAPIPEHPAPNRHYNPFDDDRDEDSSPQVETHLLQPAAVALEHQAIPLPYNPFDDDSDEDSNFQVETHLLRSAAGAPEDQAIPLPAVVPTEEGAGERSSTHLVYMPQSLSSEPHVDLQPSPVSAAAPEDQAIPLPAVVRSVYELAMSEIELHKGFHLTPRVIGPLDKLIAVVKELHVNKTIKEEDLTVILTDTLARLRSPQDDASAYEKKAQQMQGSGSKALRIIGGLMLALAAAIARTMSVALVAVIPPTAPMAAPVLTYGLGTSIFGLFAGAGSLYLGRTTGLSKSMLELHKTIKLDLDYDRSKPFVDLGSGA